MYFPFLRCKQFELLALRELAPQIGNNNLISPVLEPVKKSTTSLETALATLIKSSINFTIILNPSQGEFSTNNSSLVEKIKSSLNHYENFQIGIIIKPNTDIDQIDMQLALLDFDRPLTLIHEGKVNDIETLANWSLNNNIKYNLFGENFPFRRYRGIITPESKVLLDDKFNFQTKNADYLNNQDEFFSDDYMYYLEDGFVGFSDYLTIGNDYSEAGFAPYAVAIHLTYQKENGQIWIKHFVSDSNSDTTDVAGKFGEALEKLILFIDEKGIKTNAANEFREHHRLEHYPGLGSLKKLSIKNHLELVLNLLSQP